MGMKKKLVSFAAVIAAAGAVGAAPASAAPSGIAIPDAASLTSLCKSVKQPSLQAACNQGVATLGSCGSTADTSALVACLSKAAGSLNLSRVRLPFDIKSLIAGLTRGSTGGSGGIKLPNLGGIKLPNLGSLGGIKLPGGIDLSKLLAGLKL